LASAVQDGAGAAPSGEAASAEGGQPQLSALDSLPLILIVDDDPGVCSVPRRALGRSGFRTLEAHNGARAIELFSEQQAHIAAVLLDLTMPEISGEEVLERIMQLDPRARVIISSGYSTADLSAQIGEGSCAGFLQKP